MTPRRKLLFIALAFPPQNSSGTPRSTKFVKYLGVFGWEPIVVTLDWEKVLDRSELDYSQMDELPPDLTVYRIEPFHPLLDLGKLVRGHPPIAANLHESSENEATTHSEVPTEAERKNWLYRTVRNIYHFGLSPVGDEHFYWSLRALPECVEMAHRHQVAAIFVSVSPWTSAMLGVMLKKILSVPLVVDFRDYWTFWPVKTRRVVRDRLDAFLERLILRSADRIVCVHQAMAEDFARMEPRAADKCVVITNGYDPADFGIRDSGFGVRERTTFAHVGMIWGDGAMAFLQAVSRLRASNLAGSLQVHFVGGLPSSNLQFIRDRGLDSFVRVEPRVPHREAVARMLQADVLLLLITSSEGGRKWYPGKLFEYMAAGKPVLAVAPQGIASRLIEEAGVGVTVDHPDGERLEQMIRLATENLEEFKRRFYQPRPDVMEKYNRIALTRRLAEVFDEML